MAARTKMEKVKLSFGVEMELYLAWRAETFTGTVPAPPGVKLSPGAPLVIKGGRLTKGAKIKALALIIEEAFPSSAGTVVSLDDRKLDKRNKEWYHLEAYRRWDVIPDGSLAIPPDELADLNSTDYGWIGAEVVSPALWATNEGFDEVRRMCEFLQKHFWIYNARKAGFHVHVGNGNEWLPLNSLRQIAAFLYAADPVLAQSHPRHRTNNIYCASPRLYSNVSMGRRNPVNPTQPDLPTESVEVERPSIYTRAENAVRNFFKSRASPTKPAEDNKVRKRDQFPPRPTVGAYDIDREPIGRGLYNPIPVGPVPMITAVTEILRSADRAAISRLMSIGPIRGAYSFVQLEQEAKRTIEFRQAASMVDPVQTVAYARIAVGLCQFAASASRDDLTKIILDCEMAEQTPSWFDVYDLFMEVGLYPEAKIVQAVLSGTLTDDKRREYWLSRKHALRL
ncbi:hypothetical protein Daesc_006494 [Daldinia eschscholtzii]|uniref:Amidoligase enzyme n=1 Tax=Daldinia eschscholtzii TaxID=292717 RepID=A0AAX6MH68_9PEZI